MAPRSKKVTQCQVCSDQDSKYTCPQCRIVYCSLTCYKQHKETSCGGKPGDSSASTLAPMEVDNTKNAEQKTDLEESPLEDPKSLRPLTSLKWPYIPDESAFPDPLKANDPKTLQLPQYETIATSPAIRNILAEHKNLPALLTSIDKLRGPDREEALQRALGVTAPEIDDQLRRPELSEDVLALRKLAEAIEDSVRGGNQSALGLNWGDE